MNKNLNWLIVGKLVAPQGLKGQIRVNPISDFPERFTKPGIRWLQKEDEEPEKIELINGKQIPGKSIYIVSFKNINDRNSAEKLIGNNLLVGSKERPELKENEFHFLDLVGLDVKLEPKSNSIGQVKDLSSAGNDLLVIELNNGKEVLIPFVEEIVPIIKIAEGWVLINPPNGLLDL